MATERWSLLAAAALLLGGCLSSSIAGDLAELRARTQAPVLADVADLTVAHAGDESSSPTSPATGACTAT